MLKPPADPVIEIPPERPPMLVVVVDTEAEFDWSKPFDRVSTGVSSVRLQTRAHRIYDRYGLRPTYVVDHAVASQADGYLPLRELRQSGLCEIGAHLQPWLNPPFEETLSPRNSYPCNLPADLERRKLETLTRAIEANLGVRPRIYKAGRYGLGPDTPCLLRDMGYEIDVSVVPGADLRRKHGPDFSAYSAKPAWIGACGDILEAPLTAGFTGALRRFGPRIHAAITHPAIRPLRLPGLLARARLLDRVVLTPEGVTFAEQKRLAETLYAAGHRVFSLTYHSPSLGVGHTPYVRTESDVEAFLKRIEQFVEFFMDRLGGVPATPIDVRRLALKLSRGRIPC